MSHTFDDPFIGKIANKLKCLVEFVEKEPARKILQVDKNPMSRDCLSLARRLLNALERFDKQTEELLYVGLMGHYSSGKSSTINSLLDLWGKKTLRRRTKNNPTRDPACLLTSPSNDHKWIKPLD